MTSPSAIADRELHRRTSGQFGDIPHSGPDVSLPPRRRCSARDLDVWLGDARRFTIDGILHSRRGGTDRFLTLQFSGDPEHLEQMRRLSDRNGMQGVAVVDRSAGKVGARYDPERVLEVHVFFNGEQSKRFVTPARLVELTHAWFKSGQDAPLVTNEDEDDTPTTQANYRAMNPFSNRYRDHSTNPGGMRDYASWWKEPQDEKGLGFMDGDSVVVTEECFDLLEMKGGHGPLEDRMKRGQQMTLEAWGKLDNCRAFVIDENGTSDNTSVVAYSGDDKWVYDTTLDELRSTLVEAP